MVPVGPLITDDVARTGTPLEITEDVLLSYRFCFQMKVSHDYMMDEAKISKPLGPRLITRPFLWFKIIRILFESGT